MNPFRHEYVYFIQVNGDGPIKIGKSVSPNKRLFGLLTGCPYDMRIVGVLEPTDYEFTENELHKRFKKDHIRGEWFRATPGLLDFIAEHAKPWPWSYEEYVNPKGKRAIRMVEDVVRRHGRRAYRNIQAAGWRTRRVYLNGWTGNTLAEEAK